MVMGKIEKVLVLSPHTDDAELGAGGTIIKFINAGTSVRWLVFSTAEESLPDGFKKDSLKNEFENVMNELRMKDNEYKIYNFRVRYLHEKRQEILEILVGEKNKYNPDLVIGPSQNDVHQDHQIVSNEMVRAFKNNASILAYELPWNHFTFNTQYFVKLSEDIINKKLSLLKNYKSQLTLKRKYFSSELIKGLARIRGTQANTDFAEAFELIKWID
jgi:LmbE family N-acetylglucosaminyl deacetylase